MPKKYNLNSSSDMRRFSRDLEKNVLNMARDKANSMTFERKCPHCNSVIKVQSGINFCPICQRQIKVNLDINF